MANLHNRKKNLKKPLLDTINVKKFRARIVKTMKHYLRMCTDRLSIADLPDYETNGSHLLKENN